MKVDVVARIAEVSARDWDACAGEHNPFVEQAFLHALEEGGCVGAGTGWLPCHLVAKDAGAVVGVMPCYQKSDSFGEYIFDWQWAQAAARSRIAYYPKLTSAVPFTPATGPRLLVKPGVDVVSARAALVAAMLELERERGCSSSHVLLPRDDEVAAYRFVQRDPGHADFEVVTGAGWDVGGSAAAIAASLVAELPSQLAIRVVEVPEIDRGPGGKRKTIVRLS